MKNPHKTYKAFEEFLKGCDPKELGMEKETNLGCYYKYKDGKNVISIQFLKLDNEIQVHYSFTGLSGKLWRVYKMPSAFSLANSFLEKKDYLYSYAQKILNEFIQSELAKIPGRIETKMAYNKRIEERILITNEKLEQFFGRKDLRQGPHYLMPSQSWFLHLATSDNEPFEVKTMIDLANLGQDIRAYIKITGCPKTQIQIRRPLYSRGEKVYEKEYYQVLNVLKQAFLRQHKAILSHNAIGKQ